MMWWQWHQLDHMQTICTSLQTDNHAGTSPLSFYRPDALPATQPTASKHWRHIDSITKHTTCQLWDTQTYLEAEILQHRRRSNQTNNAQHLKQNRFYI